MNLNDVRTAVRSLLLCTALATATPGVAEAQLANASASTLALAGNHTATATGFGAISVNPAGIGAPGSGFSLAIVPTQVRLGLAPIGLSDLVDYEGRTLAPEVKEDWLTRIVAAGGENGSVGADFSALALTFGNIGFQLSSTASVDLNLPPGLVEAALYGNAGRTGTPTDLSLIGASVESYAISTAGLAFALPVNPGLVFGLTAKYSWGHGLAVGQAESGALESDPIRATMEFPLITSCQEQVGCTQDYARGGSGFGLDLGALVDLGGIRVGASLQNIISSFAWDETKLGYRPGSLLLDNGEFTTDYDELPFDQAPAELQERIADFTLKPTVRLGAALDLTGSLTLTGDVHGRLSDAGIALQPNYSTGVGAELRIGLVQLRGGITKREGGMQYGLGGALVLGPVNLSLAGGFVKGDLSDTTITQVTLSFGDR